MEIIIKNQGKVRDLGNDNVGSLSELEIQDSSLERVNEVNLKVNQLYINKCVITSCRFTNADFSDGIIKQTTWKDCDLRAINFSDSKIESCQFINCKLDDAILRSTVIKKVIFKNCDLSGLDFSNANIKQ